MTREETKYSENLIQNELGQIRISTTMDKLSEIKALAIRFPNDQEFGEKVRTLLEKSHTLDK